MIGSHVHWHWQSNIDKISRIRHNNPDNNTRHRDEFDFENQINANSMNLCCDEMTRVRSLCTKYLVIFSRNRNDMGFCDRIYHLKKWKRILCHSDVHTAAWVLRKRKAMKKSWRLGTRRLSRTKTFRLGSTIITFTKKNGTYRLVVDYRGLNKQTEITRWPLPQKNEVFESLERNMYISNIDLLSGYFQMAIEEESQNLTAFKTPLVP